MTRAAVLGLAMTLLASAADRLDAQAQRKSRPVDIVSVDTFSVRGADAVIIRGSWPDSGDVIALRGPVVNPALITQAIKQLKFLRAAQGETGQPGLYRVTVRPGRPENPGRATAMEARRRADENEVAQMIMLGFTGKGGRRDVKGVGSGRVVRYQYSLPDSAGR